MQFPSLRAARTVALSAICLSLSVGSLAIAANAQKPTAEKVTLQEDASAYTLSNGTITARVDKKSGDLLSMKYKGTEMLGTLPGPDGLPDVATDKPGANIRGGNHNFTDHQYGFWSHDTDSSTPTIDKVTIDPTSNGGERAEV